MIYISSNNIRHPVTKTFTILHPTTLHFTTPVDTSLYLSTLHFLSFKHHPATLHYPLSWLKPISVSYRSISLHFTSLHFPAILDDFRQTSIPFISLRL